MGDESVGEGDGGVGGERRDEGRVKGDSEVKCMLCDQRGVERNLACMARRYITYLPLTHRNTLTTRSYANTCIVTLT